jgi:hypothetical protein
MNGVNQFINCYQKGVFYMAEQKERCILMSDLDTAFHRPSVHGLEHYSDIYLHVESMEDYRVEIKEGTLRLYGDKPLKDVRSAKVFDGNLFARIDQRKMNFDDALKIVADRYAFDPANVKKLLELIKNA